MFCSIRSLIGFKEVLESLVLTRMVTDEEDMENFISHLEHFISSSKIQKLSFAQSPLSKRSYDAIVKIMDAHTQGCYQVNEDQKTASVLTLRQIEKKHMLMIPPLPQLSSSCRGQMLLDMATPPPKPRKPLSEISENVVTKRPLTSREKVMNTEIFLNSLKSPARKRDMVINDISMNNDLNKAAENISFGDREVDEIFSDKNHNESAEGNVHIEQEEIQDDVTKSQTCTQHLQQQENERTPAIRKKSLTAAVTEKTNVKDNLHDPSAPHPAAHAGNFMTFTSGSMCDRFFSGGILYNPNEKEVDMKEDRQLAANQALQSKAAKPLSDRNINKSKKRVEVEEAKQSSSSESSSDKSSSSEVSDSDVNPEEVYDMLEPARRVSFKPPARSNEESDISSFGDHKYGRGAERQVTAGKKKKRTERKKRAKLTVADIKTDILDNHHVQLAGNRVEHKGATRGRARGGKGGTRSKRGRK